MDSPSCGSILWRFCTWRVPNGSSSRKYWCKKPVPPTAHEWEGPIYGRDEDQRSEGFCTNTSCSGKGYSTYSRRPLRYSPSGW